MERGLGRALSASSSSSLSSLSLSTAGTISSSVVKVDVCTCSSILSHSSYSGESMSLGRGSVSSRKVSSVFSSLRVKPLFRKQLTTVCSVTEFFHALVKKCIASKIVVFFATSFALRSHFPLSVFLSMA
ncbi:hypothetical protein PGB90_009038 [Kerria lacca]